MDGISLCGNGVQLRKTCYNSSAIYLPPVTRYKIVFELELNNSHKGETAVECKFDSGGADAYTKVYRSKGYNVFFTEELIWQPPDPYAGSFLSFKLLTGGYVRIHAGSVFIIELQ
jgi:hypothetical protein